LRNREQDCGGGILRERAIEIPAKLTNPGKW
jgi:hypothetical protein